MKLSEAIRLGAMMGPQIFGTYRGGNADGTCALGAALLGIGNEDGLSGDLIEAWPQILKRTEIACPDCSRACTSQYNAIAHLNDDHRWNRQRIADWVATIEPEEVHASETNGQCSLGKGDHERIRQTAVSQA